MSIFIKICGITNDEDANLSIEYGADAIGLNQYEKSPRFVNKKELLKIKNKEDQINYEIKNSINFGLLNITL